MTAFFKKHLLEVTLSLLAVVCLGLYLFLVRPAVARKQKMAKKVEEQMARLKRYQSDPPSEKRVLKLNEEKKKLGSQYERVVEALDFAPRVALPGEIGQPHLYFEEEVARVEKELRRFEKGTGIIIPDRLGFGQEAPQNREELSTLLNQLAAARELLTLAAESRVSDVLSFSPLLPAEARITKVSRRLSLEELEFQLRVSANMSALTNFLYRLAEHPYFFTVKFLDIKTGTGPGVRRVSSPGRGRGVGGRMPASPGRGRGEGRQPGEGRLREEAERRKAASDPVLEADILVSTRLLSN